MKKSVITIALAAAAAAITAVPASAQVAKSTAAKNEAAWNEYIEDEFWARVNKTMEEDDFQAYLDAYPNGRYVPLAKLELGRARRGASRRAAPPAAPTGNASSASAAPSTAAPLRPKLVQDPSFPIEDATFSRLSDNPALAVPEAAQPLRIALEGTRTIRTPMPNGSVAVGTFPNQSVTVRVAGTPLCRVTGTQTFISNGKTISENASDGLAWAGLISLSTSSRGIGVSAAGNHTSTRQGRIENLFTAVFPLTPGKRFSFDNPARQSYNDGGRVTTLESTLSYSCQAGETVPASVLQAQLPGNAIPLQCDAVMRMNGVPETKTAPAYYYWVEQAGCFVQDPNR